MKLEYNELEDDIRLIKLTGKLDLDGTNSIEQEFTQYCSGENICVLVDLSHVMYISSIGIPILVNSAKFVNSHGGKFALLAPQPNVKSILDITGVSHIIRIYNDLETAQKRLKSA